MSEVLRHPRNGRNCPNGIATAGRNRPDSPTASAKSGQLAQNSNHWPSRPRPLSTNLPRHHYSSSTLTSLGSRPCRPLRPETLQRRQESGPTTEAISFR